jgi:lysozyme
MMQTSDAGIALIKEFEGFSAVPYKCPANKMTVGFGHVIQPGELCDEVTEETALELLKDDLQEAEQAVNELVTVPLNQNQFDALVSFTFNLGRGKLEVSTLLAKLNLGDYQGASAQITRWRYIGNTPSNGLSHRREAERSLFDKPIAEESEA